MKEYFDKVKNLMEADEMTAYEDSYWLGYIHALASVGFLSHDEHTELANYKSVLHHQYISQNAGKGEGKCLQQGIQPC